MNRQKKSEVSLLTSVAASMALALLLSGLISHQGATEITTETGEVRPHAQTASSGTLFLPPLLACKVPSKIRKPMLVKDASTISASRSFASKVGVTTAVISFQVDTSQAKFYEKFQLALFSKSAPWKELVYVFVKVCVDLETLFNESTPPPIQFEYGHYRGRKIPFMYSIGLQLKLKDYCAVRLDEAGADKIFFSLLERVEPVSTEVHLRQSTCPSHLKQTLDGLWRRLCSTRN
jgi:hypothetical protein